MIKNAYFSELPSKRPPETTNSSIPILPNVFLGATVCLESTWLVKSNGTSTQSEIFLMGKKSSTRGKNRSDVVNSSELTPPARNSNQTRTEAEIRQQIISEPLQDQCFYYKQCCSGEI